MKSWMLAAALALGGVCGTTLAQVSETHTLADGAELISLLDKKTDMGKAILLRPEAPIVRQVMPDNHNPSSINAFLVKAGDKVVLIDTGLGANSGGGLLAALKTAGVTPEQVSLILLTHMHGDHIGGLLNRDRQRAFPRARVLVHERELAYWTGDAATANPDNVALARAVRDAYGPALATFRWDEALNTPVGAIRTLNAEGHTPGHTAFEIGQGKTKTWVVGDLIHSFKVQLADPTMSVTFDVDPQLAAKSRIRLFEAAAAAGTRIAGMHIPFGGVGYLTQGPGAAFTFTAEP